MNQPPFQITPGILSLVASLQELIGEFNSFSRQTPSVKLRRENQIRTVRHSLAIEGNSLSEQQITAILEDKRVVGPQAQILEVKNALQVYKELSDFDPLKESDFLRAHKVMMRSLVPTPGRYRSSGVGRFKGTQVGHVAPPASRVPSLMGELFKFLNGDPRIPWSVKACVFHYELEFIHPFSDGNGRMGRLWQQLILMKQSPIFEFVSSESLVHKQQKEYYKVLEKCDRAGDSTLFIEFSLRTILAALQELTKNYKPTRAMPEDRIRAALEHFGKRAFSRKDYMNFNKGISTASASRDLLRGCERDLILKSGDRATATYKKK